MYSWHMTLVPQSCLLVLYPIKHKITQLEQMALDEQDGADPMSGIVSLWDRTDPKGLTGMVSLKWSH